MDMKFDVDSNGLLHITHTGERAAMHRNNVAKISKVVTDYIDEIDGFNSDDDFYTFLELKGTELLDIVRNNTNDTSAFFKSISTVKYGHILFQLTAKNNLPAVQVTLLHNGSILSYALVTKSTKACLDLIKDLTVAKAIDLVEEAIHFDNQVPKNME